MLPVAIRTNADVCADRMPELATALTGKADRRSRNGQAGLH